jgi:3-hydroxyisobutyrate dehydrogenase
MDSAPCPPLSEYRIGCVGLGSMGLAIAERLWHCAGALTVWNRTQAKGDALVALGARRAGSPREVVEDCDVVVTCLHGPAADREVYLGPEGLLGEAAAGTAFVNTSTNGPACAKQLAEAAEGAGAEYLDGAVTGRGTGAAREGRLVVLVGGPGATVERVRPVLDAIGSTVEHAGPYGAAQVLKLANNIQVAVSAASLAQALRFAVAGGVEPEAMGRLFPLSSSSSRVQELWIDAMIEGQIGTGGSLTTLGKDLQLAVDYAASLDEPATVGAAAAALFAKAIAEGYGDASVPAIAKASMRDPK